MNITKKLINKNRKKVNEFIRIGKIDIDGKVYGIERRIKNKINDLLNNSDFKWNDGSKIKRNQIIILSLNQIVAVEAQRKRYETDDEVIEKLKKEQKILEQKLEKERKDKELKRLKQLIYDYPTIARDLINKRITYQK